MVKIIVALVLFGSMASADTTCEKLTKMMWEQYRVDDKLIQATYQVGDMSDAAYMYMTDILDTQLKNHKADLELLCGGK
jgi:hypothetical protein